MTTCGVGRKLKCISLLFTQGSMWQYALMESCQVAQPCRRVNVVCMCVLDSTTQMRQEGAITKSGQQLFERAFRDKEGSFNIPALTTQPQQDQTRMFFPEFLCTRLHSAVSCAFDSKRSFFRWIFLMLLSSFMLYMSCNCVNGKVLFDLTLVGQCSWNTFFFFFNENLYERSVDNMNFRGLHTNHINQCDFII